MNKAAMNGEFKIEQGIPIPPGGGWSGMSKALRQLKIGDSVFFPGKRSNDMSSLIHQVGMTGKATCRTAPDKSGVRVWRIK